MTNDHVQATDVLGLLRGTLPKERVALVGKHVGSCRSCVARALADESLETSASALARELVDVSEHPDVETTLTQYVDRTLDSGGVDVVETHLATCARCREDVADLRSIAALPRDTRRPWWLAAAAAAAVIVIALLATQRSRQPPAIAAAPQRAAPPPATSPATIQPSSPASPPPGTYARNEWTAAVNDALRGGALAMPAALMELQLAPDTQRAPASSASAKLEPAAAIIDEARPRFRWTATRDATYVVSIFNGGEFVAESPRLARPEWQPKQALPRGETYQWQIEVRTADTTTILPAPPAPPALFRILERSAHEELVRARERHGNDPLLLGILYARNGLRAEAERELAKVDTPEGRKLLRSVRQWSS
jgi:anti-sigma factor RsiW